ncbi:hypothetical protein DCC85_18195 [Paenibacillus sp. CAA11]|nr:hypothetical protein DCC85_18195 [Paenibacillus sp. CAA11]
MIIIAAFACNSYSHEAYADSLTEREVTEFLQNLYNDRNRLLLDQEQSHIQNYYMVDNRKSRYAFNREIQRAGYLHEWAKQRRVKFVDADGKIRIVRMSQSGDTAKVTLVNSLRLRYQYDDDPSVYHDFGVGTRHSLTLKKKSQSWLLESEWYLDPLEEDPKTIQACDVNFSPVTASAESSKIVNNYNRDRAVAYANKYAGLAWGAGNNQRYNQKYLDYTSRGGDCTNFSSQAIGDPDEGGGLRRSSEWRYIKRTGGTRAWVNTDGFKSFLVRSGYARVLAQGDYIKVVEYMNKASAQGGRSVQSLEAGDLIAYVIGGDIDHFSIVVGFDKQGYPLVNSHTADRYMVPFDLGWDKFTKYQLIHIRD